MAEKEHLTADEMAVFYQQFYKAYYWHHRQYNKEWYRKNLYCLWLGLRVTLQQLFTVKHSNPETGQK